MWLNIGPLQGGTTEVIVLFHRTSVNSEDYNGQHSAFTDQNTLITAWSV